jgi:hypothetical protein
LEPLDLYNQFFATFADIFRELIGKLRDITANPVNAELIADLIDGREAQKAFRYLTAPPISADDLEKKFKPFTVTGACRSRVTAECPKYFSI